MQEDELVHLLSDDGEVRELFLVDGRECLSLSAKLRAQSRPHGIRSRSSHRKAEELVVVASPLRLGLHSDLEPLKAAVYDNIRSLESGERIEDRIALALGGNEKYDRTLSRASGRGALHDPHVGIQLEGDGPGGRSSGQAPGYGGDAQRSRPDKGGQDRYGPVL